MEEGQKMCGLVSQLLPEELYSEELDVAVRAVQMACFLCQKLQQHTLISNSRSNIDHIPSEVANSSVTLIAGWSVKAIVSWILSECLGSENISIIAEDNFQTLSETNASELLEAVVQTVNEYCVTEAPRFGVVKHPKPALTTSEVLEIISRCYNSVGGRPSRRFWALSPVDDVLGFLEGDQYAIALSLFEDGEVVLGVIGCPNYPMRKEWLSYQYQYHRIISRLTPPTSETWNKGCVIYAKRGSGKAWMQPLLHANEKFVWPNNAKLVSISAIENLPLATFCEPFEKANSSHSYTEGLAHSVGLSKAVKRQSKFTTIFINSCIQQETAIKSIQHGEICGNCLW